MPFDRRGPGDEIADLLRGGPEDPDEGPRQVGGQEVGEQLAGHGGVVEAQDPDPTRRPSAGEKKRNLSARRPCFTISSG